MLERIEHSPQAYSVPSKRYAATARMPIICIIIKDSFTRTHAPAHYSIVLPMLAATDGAHMVFVGPPNQQHIKFNRECVYADASVID